MSLQLLQLKLPCHSSEGYYRLAGNRKCKDLIISIAHLIVHLMLKITNETLGGVAHTDPWVVWAGTTIRTPGGRDVTVTGDFPGWLGRTVTTDAPVADC